MSTIPLLFPAETMLPMERMACGSPSGPFTRDQRVATTTSRPSTTWVSSPTHSFDARTVRSISSTPSHVHCTTSQKGRPIASAAGAW